MSKHFKTYHFTIVDQLQNDEEAVLGKREVLGNNELKVIELISCIGELIADPAQTTTGTENELAAPQQSDATPPK